MRAGFADFWGARVSHPGTNGRFAVRGSGVVRAPQIGTGVIVSGGVDLMAGRVCQRSASEGFRFMRLSACSFMFLFIVSSELLSAIPRETRCCRRSTRRGRRGERASLTGFIQVVATSPGAKCRHEPGRRELRVDRRRKSAATSSAWIPATLGQRASESACRLGRPPHHRSAGSGWDAASGAPVISIGDCHARGLLV